VDGGLGKTVPIGTVTLIPPTDTIKRTGEKRVIDGVQIVFQMAPRTEAPAEMLFYFPQFRALCTAEDITHTLHNLYTLRGAEVRDAREWWKTINQTIDMFGDKTEVVFASHHWPRWGNERIVEYLKKQRDLYKYINDQSLRLLNEGYTMIEVAEILRLPKSIAVEWYNRGYYGTVNHDAKAVYQKYLGWYDSNPANLYPLPPEVAAKKYVEYMGGTQAVIAKAREDLSKGNYRWVAEVMKNVVFAEPDNQEAKNLEADALEQLGYQSESGPWRNEFLMGAYELRNGVPKVAATKSASPDTIKAMTLDMYFDYMGVRLNGPRADNKTVSLNWIFTDVHQEYAVRLEDSVLVYTANRQLPNADATLTLTRATSDEITLGKTTFDDAIASGAVKVVGSKDKIAELFGLLDTFNPMFDIVTPGPSDRSLSGGGLSATSGEEFSPLEAE
jgi:alkyl sulfatase BDS1-like metallo-beta-lactamase superfamily hydrolase